MATCVDLAGAKYPQEQRPAITPLEGQSLVPAFAGKPLDRDAIFWEHEGNRAVRAGDWKLVAKGPAGTWETVRHRPRPHRARRPRRQRAGASAHDDRPMGIVGRARTGTIPWIWQPPYGK